MRRDPHQLESEIFDEFEENARAVIFDGSCEKFLASIPNETIQLIVTSPPYNLGKTYEKRVHLDEYLKWQEKVIAECVRVLAPSGSI